MKNKEIINIDLNELKETFINSKDNNSVIAINLIDKAIFLEDTLKRLEDEMVDGDVIQDMPQGNYSIKVVNPVLKSYNTTIKNYQTIMKQINEMVDKKFTNNNLLGEDSKLVEEYNLYVKGMIEWIENQKNIGTYKHLTDEDKRIMDYKEWKENRNKLSEEFEDFLKG